MENVPVFTFWAAAFLIFYTYVGYAAVILLLSIFRNNPVAKDDGYEPTVTFLITAYNEEKDLARKIENTLALDYPKEKIEVLVASDGSTDGTDEIVRRFMQAHGNVRLLRVEGRVGKTETQNQAVRTARGEVLIFSDATTEYSNDAVRKIVRNYADRGVGAVSGRYNYTTLKGSSMGISTVLFWNYENFIKSRQTRIRTISGCCGCIYSVRRDLFAPLPGAIISDLVEPLKIIAKGYRVVFEPEAVAYETTTEKVEEEFKMRVRVITRGMNGLLYMRSIFNPLRHAFVSFQLLSHKVFRWLVPLFLALLFVSSAMIADRAWFYAAAFALQGAFYLFAFLGWVADRHSKKIRLFSVPLYFCVVNIASLVSLFRVIKGKNQVMWETVRN